MNPATHRRSLRTLSHVAAAAMAGIIFSASGSAEARPSIQGVVLRVAGPAVAVRSFTGGPLQASTADMPMAVGMVVRTADHRAELAYPDGTSVEVSPNSSVRLQPTSEAMLSVGAPTRVTRIDLRSGSIRVRVGRGARPVLVLAGKDEYAVVREGVGRIQLDSRGITSVMEEGTGMLASGGRWSVVPASHYLTIGPKRTGLRALPAAPVFSAEPCEATETRACAIAVALGDAPARVAARWSPLPSGLRPVMTLSTDRQGVNVVSSRRPAESTSEFVADLPSGSYWLSVRAVGADGVEGPAATFPLRVVRLVADEETVVRQEDRTALISSGHRVRVVDPTDLRIEEPGHVAVPDPSSLSLRPTESKRPLRFAIAAQPNQHTWFVLHRRIRHAEVSISPGTAIWPRDPLSVSIELRDNADPSANTDTPRVQLEINGVTEPIAVSRAGSGWAAQIAPRHGRGPWTIRAGVFDRDGERIGHGVLHVISQHELAALDASKLP